MKAAIAVPAISALVIRAYSHNSLTPGGIIVAALTAIAHAVHPWSLPFWLLVVFFLAGTQVTKVLPPNLTSPLARTILTRLPDQERRQSNPNPPLLRRRRRRRTPKLRPSARELPPRHPPHTLARLHPARAAGILLRLRRTRS